MYEHCINLPENQTNMNNEIETDERLNAGDFMPEKLPSGLNVLTILTYIGSAISLLGTIYSFATAKTTFENKDAALEKMNDPNMPGFAKAMMPDTTHFEDMVTKSYENRIPILLISLIAVGLCIAGAMQMRQRKKQGYLLYVIGELLPFIGMVFFIGTYVLTGGGGMIGIGIALLFIILYTLQRKHLVN